MALPVLAFGTVFADQGHGERHHDGGTEALQPPGRRSAARAWARRRTATEAAVNSAMPASSSRRRPTRSPSRPTLTIRVVDGQQVGEDDPLHLREGGGEGLGHGRQADIGDAGAERGHQHGEGKAGQRPWHRKGCACGVATAWLRADVIVLAPMARNRTSELRRRASGMAERAAVALHSCIRRHITIGPCYGRCMAPPDLNLLVTLDVLLAEGSVARAARRLRLSPSAMSRALARLRETTGDPLLVRAGRGLVPTPRAIELRERVGQLVQEAQAVLRPAETLDLARLVRTFTLRTSDGLRRELRAGPDRTARQGSARRAAALRAPSRTRTARRCATASVDLETGVVGKATGPEVRAQALFRDRFVGVVRTGHPLRQGRDDARPLCRRPAHPGLAAGARAGAGRRGPGVARAGAGDRHDRRRLLDRAGPGAGLRPDRHRARAPHRRACAPGCTAFPLPVPMPDITVSMLWHPRLDADPAHRWLRGCVRKICAARFQGLPMG